jgi:ABC-type glycerol-3-phosphate transport system permease component
MSWVDLDYAGLAAGCVRHLCDLGHERIAFVNRSEQLFRIGYGTSWGPLMATATIIAVPVVCVFAIFQRFIVGGLTAGSVKA